MAKNLELKIITPDALIYASDDVLSVSVPSTAGEVTILPNHVPLITPIRTGEIKIKKDTEELYLSVHGGILEVREGSKVAILADRSEMSHLIDVERAEAAYERAKEIRDQINDASSVDYARISGLLEKELNRIKIGKKRLR